VSPSGGIQKACPAKLNLFLEIRGRRPDGYHELSTVMVPVDLMDTLEVEPARAFRLEVGPVALPGLNTVEKAYRAVARRRRIPPVRVRLTKRIPAGSGLGGGSSDAAAMIEALDELFDLGLNRHEVAAEIGSDVNFFLERGPALCTGRGERVAPIVPGRPLEAVIVWPGYSLSTAEVYRRAREFLTPKPRDVIDFLNKFARGGTTDLGRALFNRLEGPAFGARPELRQLLRSLSRLPFRGTRMSGSGSALYGLCESRAEARRLAGRVRASLDAWVFPVSSLTGDGSWKLPKSASSSPRAGATSSGRSARSPSKTRSSSAI
jgi:4-diphosphocytidyl-2-C-methyl-D-erythritol kinase